MPTAGFPSDRRPAGSTACLRAAVTAEAITSPADPEQSHHWPVWLPGERQFLYRADTGAVFRASLDGGAPTKLFDADSRVAYVDPGYLVFVRGTALMAQGSMRVEESCAATRSPGRHRAARWRGSGPRFPFTATCSPAAAAPVSRPGSHGTSELA